MSDEPSYRAPRAVRIGPEAEAEVGRRSVELLPEQEPIEAEAPAPPAPARRGIGWGSLFVAGLGGFLSIAGWVWIEQTVARLLAANPPLGYAALVFAGLAGLALAAMLLRIARDILRERKVEALRERAAAALAAQAVEPARAVARELLGLYESRPATARGRAELSENLPQLFAARDVLAVAERSLIAPLDAEAQALIAQAARRVSLVTAVSPRALVDIVFVLVACSRLLRAIAGVYAGRPGALGLMRLARQVMSHLVLTGGVAAGDALVQQVLGQGLAARLSAKLGEGVLNGLLTARIGLAALEVCRPLPFVEARRPSLGEVVGDLSGWRGA